MREFLIFILSRLVDQPDKIIIDQQEREENIVFSVQVAGSDVGKVVARSGRNADAIRTLLKAVAAKEGKRIVIDIAD